MVKWPTARRRTERFSDDSSTAVPWPEASYCFYSSRQTGNFENNGSITWIPDTAQVIRSGSSELAAEAVSQTIAAERKIALANVKEVAAKAEEKSNFGPGSVEMQSCWLELLCLRVCFGEICSFIKGAFKEGQKRDDMDYAVWTDGHRLRDQ